MSLIRDALLKVVSHHTLALLRWDIHFIGLRVVNFLLMKKYQLRNKLRKSSHPVYLNLGSGPRGLVSSNWINVDGYSDANVTYCMDFNSKFPFEDNCFDAIFSEHVLEHFSIENGQRILSECCRVLRPGGSLRIIVPDGERIMRSYFDSPIELLARRSVDSACAMEAVNSYFRQRYEHQIAYDETLLRHQFVRAGFTEVTRVSFGKGSVSVDLLIDDQKYEWESLYMEAIKPPTGYADKQTF